MSLQEMTKRTGWLEITLLGPDGEIKAHEIVKNLITAVGDRYYAERAAGISSPPGQVTGMKLGTGANSGGSAPSKSGGGAALTTYLTGSDHALDGSFPASSTATVGPDTVRRIQWQATWAPTEATTGSPITEVVLVNDTLADATSTAANTISRAAISTVSSKGDQDTLIVTWNHDSLGS